MASRRELRDNKRAFKRAQREAKKSGQHVGGVLHNGVPVYFVHPAGATNDEIAEAAFVAVNGRPRSDAERMLGHMAQAQ